MLLDQIIFFLFAAIALVGAVLVVTSRNAIHSAIWLITTLLATAGIYLQLKAEFLFAVQIILYVGGIMVLFIFVIMLVNLDVAVRQIQFNRQTTVALVLALALGGLLPALHFFRAGVALGARRIQPLGPNTEAVGKCYLRGTWCRLRLLRCCCWWR